MAPCLHQLFGSPSWNNASLKNKLQWKRERPVAGWNHHVDKRLSVWNRTNVAQPVQLFQMPGDLGSYRDDGVGMADGPLLEKRYYFPLPLWGFQKGFRPEFMAVIQNWT